jgi:type I restriction enzyme R subunit
MVTRNTTIDWTVRVNVWAHLRALVKRILEEVRIPPDKQEKATRAGAGALSASWAMG